MDYRSLAKEDVAALSQAMEASVKAREAIMRRIHHEEDFDLMEAWEEVEAYDYDVRRLLASLTPNPT